VKLVGVRDGRQVLVAVLLDGGVTPIAPVDAFWADLADARRTAAAVVRAERAVGPADLAPVVPADAQVFCLGLNYRAHAEEGDYEVPRHPTVFGRWARSLSVSDVAVPVPVDEPGLDWEGEVAAVVGSPLVSVDAATAETAVFGHAVFNDLSARVAQKLTAQWTLGKNADRSGPMGPLVTVDETGPLSAGLTLSTRVNGELVQQGDTRDLLFGVGEVLALVSRTTTLRPGDVLVTGTPSGVGYARTPPWLLQPGDVVEVEATGLGRVRTPVVAAGAP
jgi:2,4-didehydro-3-deoxy-L-rhamnonate hydrolase